MNKRIRELAKQALKQPDTDNDGLTVFDNDELEKFAQLNISDCIQTLKKICNVQIPQQIGYKYGVTITLTVDCPDGSKQNTFKSM